MANRADLKETLALALRLSPLDKIRLVERVVSTLEDDLVVPSIDPLARATAEELTHWKQQTWTDEEIQGLMNQKPMSREDFVAWLDANPPTEPWGDLADDEDTGEYIHRMRRQSSVALDEPEDME